MPVSASAPAVHLLCLDGEAHAPAYEVYFVGPALPETTGMDGMSEPEKEGHYAILVCAEQPAPGWLERLGPRAVWMASVGCAQDELQLLSQALLDPLRQPGLYGVDLADYRMALGRGKQIVVRTSNAACARDAIGTFGQHLESPVALCLHLRLPMAAGMPEIDAAVLALESTPGVMTLDPPLVLAVHCEERCDVQATLLVVYP